MPAIPYSVNITGHCPYLNKKISINVKYKELTFMGGSKGNHFNETDCKYFNDCQLYTEP